MPAAVARAPLMAVPVMLLAAAAVILLPAAAHGKGVGADWINLTVYRKTPLNYTRSVRNMNTGDPAGDLWCGPYCSARPCPARLA